MYFVYISPVFSCSVTYVTAFERTVSQRTSNAVASKITHHTLILDLTKASKLATRNLLCITTNPFMKTK